MKNFEPEILSNPLTNRGTAFTTLERDRLGLTGRLPSAVETLDDQADRSYAQLGEEPSDLAMVIDMLKDQGS
jgi:malate dehydrogenase (oxaloacetate-decarboxylating)